VVWCGGVVCVWGGGMGGCWMGFVWCLFVPFLCASEGKERGRTATAGGMEAEQIFMKAQTENQSKRGGGGGGLVG
jgi:hypothetical protein